jgi:hypothetical protein
MKSVKFTDEHNIVTCEHGHSFSFHTEEARLLKEEGFCQGCRLNELEELREAQGIVDVSVEVPLPYGIPVGGTMDEAAVEMLSRKITAELTPIMLGKAINPEYLGDIKLRKRVEMLEKEVEMLRKWGENVGVDRADHELERLWGRDWRRGRE